jgi:hypothetical protein
MNGEVPFVVGSLIGWVNGYKNHMFLGDLWSLVVMIGMTQIQRLKFPLIRPSSEMDKRHDKDQNEIRNTKFEIRNKFETQNSNTQTKSLRWFWWGLTIVGLGVVGWSQSRSAVAGIAVGVWMLWRYRHPGLDSGSIQTRAWIPDKAIRMRSRLYQDDEKEILDHVKRDTGKAKAFAGMTDKPWVRWFIGLALAGLFLWVSSYKSILRSRPYWVQSILGIYYYPLGVGMGGYDVVWQDSRVQWWPGGYSTLAHSLPLEFVVGLGVPGLVFSVWMAVHLLRLARPDYSPLLRGRAMAGVLWVVLGVNFLINTSYTVPALVLLWYWLLGVSDD